MSQFLGEINLLRTLFLRCSHVVNKTVHRNVFGVLVYKKMLTEISSDGMIELNSGRLELGKSWSKKVPFSSILKIGKGARLIVNGSFSFYDRSVIFVNDNATMELGNFSYVNSNATIHCFKNIRIGNNVVISDGLTMRDSDNHQMKGAGEATQPIVICDNVWIGMNVTILKGVTIGEGSVIAAGAVVNRSIPAYSLAGGVPAKVIRTGIEWSR